jgi:tricarballylate dehydrogenase
MSSDETYDLVVIGCGGAGLSTAVSYAETAQAAGREARIAVLERSPEEERGASTRWTTAGMRVDRDFVLDPKWIGEIQQFSEGLTDLELCLAFEKEVPETGRFLKEHGVEFIHVDPGMAIGIHKAMASPNGGGLAIVDNMARALEQHPGATILYQTEAVSLVLSEDGHVSGVRVRSADGSMRTLFAETVMVASGGFEGNYEMLTQYVGRNAVDLKKLVPGTRFNTGDGIRMAREIGAAPAGQYDEAHYEAIDPRTDRPDAVIGGHNFSIVVDTNGRRFLDEGERNMLDSFEKVARQIFHKTPDNKAFYITDEAVMSQARLSGFFDTDVPPAKADTIAELATQLGLEPSVLEQTVAEFNAACRADVEWDPSDYDGKSTQGVTPPKSNWANPIAQAPFYGYPVATAICFTYGGLKTDTSSRVLSNSGFPIPGLYAAGEIQGLTYKDYPALTNVLRSCTFGRIAGAHAATHAREAVAVR